MRRLGCARMLAPSWSLGSPVHNVIERDAGVLPLVQIETGHDDKQTCSCCDAAGFVGNGSQR